MTHRMRTIIPTLSLGLAMIGGLLNASPASAKDQGVTDTSIKIGMHSSMTGPIAVFGLTYQRVAKILIDDVNAAGGINGRKIDLIVEDDRGDPAGGVAAVTKLIDRDKVFLVLGGPFTPVTMAVYPKVIQRGIIYWSPDLSAPAFTKPFQRLTFDAQETLDDQGSSVVKLALSMKPKKIAWIGENNEYGRTTHDSVVEELAKAGKKLDIDLTIEADTASATPQIAAIKAAGADVILHGGTPKALSFIIREIYAQGVKAPLISFGGGSSASIFDLVQKDAKIEYYAVNPLACQLTDPCVATFNKEWAAHYPNDPPLVWSAQGYAAIQLFLDGLRRAGRNLTTDNLIKTYETMPEFKSPIIAYPMKFSPTSHRSTHGGFLDGFKDGKHDFFGDQIKG